MAGTEFNAANVEKAVGDFYCNASVQHLQQEVHRWLTAAQVSQEAWSFSWELLDPNRSVQVQFFGASCLHVKISRYWCEVPVDQYESLRTRLLDKIIQYGNGPKMILTRMCVALASFAMHTMPEIWKDPVHSLITTFQQESTLSPLSASQRCNVLLECLTVMPEEIGLHIDGSNIPKIRRAELRKVLADSLKHIIPLLESLMNSGSPTEVYTQALRCFGSWVEFGISVNDGETIILQVFQSLQNIQLFDTAVDTLVTVFSHPESHRYTHTIRRLMPMVLQLQDMLNKAIQSSDMDTCQGVTQVVVAIAENHPKIILDSSISVGQTEKDNILKFLHLVLACSSVPGFYPVDEICSNMTFTFWYILQDTLLDQDSDRCRLLLPIFQPIYLNLIEILLVKVQYPTDEMYSDWNAEEKEQFRCYRQDIGDTMMYAYSILREPLLGHLCNVLVGIIQNKEDDVRWQVMEAIFFLFGSVAESVDLDESIYLPSLLELLPRIPFNNIKFISTALYMIGSFGEWMSCHPESLRSVIPLVLQGLNNTEVAMAATMALKDVTRENLDHIQPYAQQILQASQTIFQTGILKARENIRLMSCVGQVLSVLPLSEIMQNLNPILLPHIQELERLASLEPSASVKNGLLLKLNMLSWLFASLDTERDRGDEKDVMEEEAKPKEEGPKPVFVILQQIAPILQTIVSKWISDPGVIEALCEMFKRALQTLMDDFAPLSKDVAELLIQMYQAVPHASILDLTKQLIIMFHNHDQFSSVVKLLLTSVCSRTLQLFQGDIRQHPDVVEGFMLLLSQVLKKTQHMIADGSCNTAGLFSAAVFGMSMAEPQTVKGSCIFMTELLSLNDTPSVREVVTGHGQVLLDRIMRAIGGEAPRMVMEHISDVLFTLNKNFSREMQTWMSEVLNKEGYPSVRATQKEKENFIKFLLREKNNRRVVRGLVKEFSLLCRGLLGTEYASQMTGFL